MDISSKRLQHFRRAYLVAFSCLSFYFPLYMLYNKKVVDNTYEQTDLGLYYYYIFSDNIGYICWLPAVSLIYILWPNVNKLLSGSSNENSFCRHGLICKCPAL